MFFKKKAIVLALFASCCESGIALADTSLNQKLIDQAQYWLQRGREDNAADAWRKLLKIDPNNVDALVSLGTFEAQNGNSEQAKIYLAKLKQLQPAGAQVRVLEEALNRGTAGKGQLDAARAMAQKGDAEGAVERFKAIGDPEKLKGDAALEYYQILAGTLQGYDAARRGLEKLLKENPGNDRYALALAQVMTYREPSRREGIRLLAELSKKPDVSKQAEESWRQALIWMGNKKGDDKLYLAFLEKNPNDQFIKDRLANLNKPQRNVAVEHNAVRYKPVITPLSLAQTRGYKALEAGDIKTAEAEFNKALRINRKDPAALGGLGLVKMKQDAFAEARDLIKRAIDHSSSKGKAQWREAYASASYYGYIEEANSARENGENQKGIALIRKAVAVNGKDPQAVLMLGDALLAENDYVGAEANYRRVIAEHPDNEQAISSLFGMLVQQKRNKDAMQLLNGLSPEQRDRLGGAENLQVSDLLDKAKAAEAAGDMSAAQIAYEDALLLAPDNVWVRLALAKMYQRRGMPAQARSLLDPMLEVEQPQPEAYYVSALLSAEQRLWWEGLSTLEKVPEASRTPEMAVLQKRLWIQVQFDRVAAFNKLNDKRSAAAVLKQVETAAGNDPEFVGAVAAGYIQNGDTMRGFNLLRQAVQKNPQAPVLLRLQYGDALLRTGQEAELSALVRQISAMPNLQADELAALKNLKLATAIRQADSARQAGNLAAAYDYIAPSLAEFPDNNQLRLALARMYSTAGDTMQAAELYVKVLQTEPDNTEARQALVYAGIQIKDYAGAELHLNALLQQEPNNPRYVALAGRLARAQGNNGKALELFKQALALERGQQPVNGQGVNGLRLVDQQGPTTAGASPATDAANVNPFAGMTNVKADANGKLQNSGPSLKEVGRQNNLPALTPAVPAAAPASTPATMPAAPVPATPPTSSNGWNSANMNGGAVLPGVTTLDEQQPAPVTVAPRTVSRAATLPALSGADAAAQNSVEAGLQQEIDSITEQNKSSITAGFVARARSGQVGLSQLKDLETPLELQLNTLGTGKFGLKIIPVFVDAGMLYLNDSNVNSQFGRNAQIAQTALYNKLPFSTVAQQNGLSGVSQLSEQSKGVALALSYEIASLKVDIGTSPIGFPIRNVVGGLRWSQTLDEMRFGVELSRRSVSDSFLSYAGTSDSLYGLKWGGVTKNGLRGDWGYDVDEGGIYANLGYAALIGQNVERNSMWELGAGAYWHFYRGTDTIMTTGLNMTAFGYQKNLSYFTYGQGGYFSPQSYFALGVPLEITGRKGKLSYLVGGSLGIQHFRQDDSPYYPNGTADQASLTQFAAANPTLGIPTVYPGQSTTGVQYKVVGALEYQMAAHFFLGGRISVDNSGDFTDSSGLIYLRYNFEQQKALISFPPVAPKPYYLGY